MNALERNQKAWRETGEKIKHLESENALLKGVIERAIKSYWDDDGNLIEILNEAKNETTMAD